MDSDLNESISALKQAFERAAQAPQLGSASPELLDRLKEKLRLPRRYRSFLKACDPIDVEIATPADSATLAVNGDALRPGQGHSPKFWALWLLAAAAAGGLLVTIGGRARRRRQATMLQRRMDALAAELEPEGELERELVNS